MRLKQSSVTTSSSLPSISEIRPAIHLAERSVSTLAEKLGKEWRGWVDALFHNLQVDLLHVNLLAELGGEFGALEELRINAGRHGRQSLRYAELSSQSSRSSVRGRSDGCIHAKWLQRSCWYGLY